jgi:hypothetical protein
MTGRNHVITHASTSCPSGGNDLRCGNATWLRGPPDGASRRRCGRVERLPIWRGPHLPADGLDQLGNRCAIRAAKHLHQAGLFGHYGTDKPDLAFVRMIMRGAVTAISIRTCLRNSTFPMLCWVLRPEMSIRVNQDSIYCAALRAQKSAKAQLSALRRNIGHLIHRRATFLAVSWGHHPIQRLDRLNGFRQPTTTDASVRFL